MRIGALTSPSPPSSPEPYFFTRAGRCGFSSPSWSQLAWVSWPRMKGNEGRLAVDGSRIAIRTASPRDAASWLRLRHALWPDGTEDEHREEIDRFFPGRAREPKAVLVAENAAGHVIGVVELSIRPYAEGCH